MIEPTPGLAQSGFELLRLIGRQRLTIDALIGGLRRIAGMPSHDVMAIAQELNWIEVDGDGLLGVTAAGARVLDHDAYPSRLRMTLLDHATLLSPSWLQAARDGRGRVLAFAPIGIRQLLVEAEVAEGTATDIVSFWDQLAALARGQRDQRLNVIGRCGERLSVEHEMCRTGHVPRWVALDSNADGYDILSVIDAFDPAPLTIEVKTSTRGMVGAFILTRNEWETGLAAPAYCLHLWDVSDIKLPRRASLGIDEVRSHVPADIGEGRWEQVTVPFGVFEAAFQPHTTPSAPSPN